MEKKVEKKENLEVVITISSNGEEWKKAQEKEYKKRASKVKIDGFRPGHAPENLVKARVNQAEVMNDALIAVANKGYQEAVEENKLFVFTEPKLNVTKITADELEATITFSLPPEVTLGEYKKLGVALEPVVVSEEDIKNYVENLQKQHAVMQVKEGAAELHDTVVIDFKGYIDGVAFDGGEAKGYELELGSNMFIPGFEDQLVGIKAGESKEVNVKFPENYVASLKGKDAKFEVTCSDVKKKVFPEINADFVKELNLKDVETVEALNEYAKKNVLATKEQEAKNKQLEGIINKAVENATVVIPTPIVEEESNAMLASMKKQIEQAGLTYEDYIQINKIDEKVLTESRMKEAEKNLKAMLVVEKIIATENIVVSDEKVEEQYKKLADQYNMPVDQVKTALEKNKDQFVKQLRNTLFNEFMIANN